MAPGAHSLVSIDLPHPLQGQYGNAAFPASHQPDQLGTSGQERSGLVEKCLRSRKHDSCRPYSDISGGFGGNSLTMVSAQTGAGETGFLVGFLGAKLFLKLHQAKGFLSHRLVPFSQNI